MSEAWKLIQDEVYKEIKESGLLRAVFSEIEFLGLNVSPGLSKLKLGISNSISMGIAQKEIIPVIHNHLTKTMTGKIEITIENTQPQNPVQLNLLHESHERNEADAGIRSPAIDFKPTWFMNPNYKLTNFVNGEHSDFAFKCIQMMTSVHNPPMKQLFLYGPSGVGKTHLLHAFGWKFKELAIGSNVKVFSAEEFINDFHLYLMKKQMPEFRGKYRLQTDVLLIDDIHILGRVKAAQEEMFNILNYYEHNRKFIAFTSDKSPHDLEGFEERLLTRFQGGLSANISLPDLSTRIQIAQNKQYQFGFNLKLETIQYIASAMTNSIRSLEGAVYKVGTYQQLKGSLVTEHELSLLLPKIQIEKIEFSVESILSEIAKEFHLKINDLKSANRKATVVQARNKAMYRVRHELSFSYSEIGRIFCKDHSTVMSAISKYEKIILSK